MSHHYRFSFFAKTDVGKVRCQNEDAIAIREGLQLAVLADGMGGYNAGEVASSIAIEVIPEELSRWWQKDQLHQAAMRRLCLIHAVRKANTEIINAAHHEPKYRGMGTTVVLAWLQHNSISIAHVGDSRAYRLHDHVFEQITHDHSLLQEQIDAGLIQPELARSASNHNVITRAVGVHHQLTVDVSEYAVAAGDVYLLCSDGLSDRLSSAEMQRILQNAQDDLSVACDTLIDAANAAGGQDNISVILIKINEA